MSIDAYHQLKRDPRRQLYETIDGYIKNTTEYPLRFYRSKTVLDAKITKDEFDMYIIYMPEDLMSKRTKVTINYTPLSDINGTRTDVRYEIVTEDRKHGCVTQ